MSAFEFILRCFWFTIDIARKFFALIRFEINSIINCEYLKEMTRIFSVNETKTTHGITKMSDSLFTQNVRRL